MGNPMTFTDDDLKRLKKYRGQLHLPSEEMLALLARLEAAEAICADVVELNENDECGCVSTDLIEAWRKAAGK